MSKPPYLVITQWQDTHHFHIEYFENTMTRAWREQRKIPITEEQSHLCIEDVKTLYKEQITASFKAASTPEAEKPIRMRKSDFLEILEKIIKTSHHEGEIEAAKNEYKKVSGKPYAG